MPEKKQKGKKRVWLWAVAAALVVGVGAAAFYLPSTDFYQGFMRFERPVAKTRDAVIEGGRVVPPSVDVDTMRGGIQERVKEKLDPSNIESVRGLPQIVDSIDSLQVDVDRNTVAFNEMEVAKHMAEAAVTRPALLEALKHHMEEIPSNDALLEEAKIVSIEEGSSPIDENNGGAVKTFRAGADSDVNVDTIKLFFEGADIESMEGVMIEFNGEVISGKWVRTYSDVFKFQFEDPVDFESGIDNEINVVVEGEHMTGAADVSDSMILDVASSADDSVTAGFNADFFEHDGAGSRVFNAPAPVR